MPDACDALETALRDANADPTSQWVEWLRDAGRMGAEDVLLAVCAVRTNVVSPLLDAHRRDGSTGLLVDMGATPATAWLGELAHAVRAQPELLPNGFVRDAVAAVRVEMERAR